MALLTGSRRLSGTLVSVPVRGGGSTQKIVGHDGMHTMLHAIPMDCNWNHHCCLLGLPLLQDPPPNGAVHRHFAASRPPTDGQGCIACKPPPAGRLVRSAEYQGQSGRSRLKTLGKNAGQETSMLTPSTRLTQLRRPCGHPAVTYMQLSFTDRLHPGR